MGLGTEYPVGTGSPGAGGGPRGKANTGGVSAPAPRPSDAYYMPGFGSPTTGQPRDFGAHGSTFIDPLIAQFTAVDQAQRQGLTNRSLIDQGFGQLGYDNNMWFKQASADNDLARLGLQKDRDVGLAKEGNAADRGFAGRGFEIDSRGNALTRDMRYRANDSEAAAKGSITSFGYGQNERDILGQFGIAQDTTQLQYDKKISDLDISDKAIGSLAKEFDIRASDVMNALKYSSTQLGLDWEQTQRQIKEALDSGNAELNMQALNFMQQMMAMPIKPPSATDLFPGGVPTVSPEQMAQRAPRAGVGGDVPPNLGTIDPTKQVF